MQTDRRWCPRWSVTKCYASITVNNQQRVYGPIIDISRGGAYVANVQLNINATAFVKIESQEPDAAPIERWCTILPNRAGCAGGCAVKFDLPLIGAEIAAFAVPADAHGSLELARQDYAMVCGELDQIQSCRSQYFMGSLAAISAWTITAISIALTCKLTSPLGAMIGVSLPFILLTLSVFVMLEKANAINLRKGFLAALSDYLRTDLSPPNFLGWIHLKMNRSECSSRLASGLCPSTNTPCWNAAEKDVERLTAQYHYISNGLDSFMALVSMVYAVLYFAASAILSGVGAYFLLHARVNVLVLSLVELAAWSIIIFIAAFLYYRVRSLRKGNRSAEAYYLQWVLILRSCRSVYGIQTGAPSVSKEVLPQAQTKAAKPRSGSKKSPGIQPEPEQNRAELPQTPSPV